MRLCGIAVIQNRHFRFSLYPGDLWMWLQLMWLQFKPAEVRPGSFGVGLGTVWGPKGPNPATNRRQTTPPRTA
jgi:hypothetical protein